MTENLLKHLSGSLVFIHIGLICFSQVSEAWVARYNGPASNWDESYSMAVDASKNVYVTGKSLGAGPPGDHFFSDYVTIKYNEFGSVLWVRSYNGTANAMDIATAIAVDNSGNVYVTGASDAGYTGGGFHHDYVTIKYNSAGVSQWVARYNGPGNADDGPIAIAVDGSGNVFVTGGSVGSGTGEDYATIKYNSAGVQQWVSRYNGPGNSYDRVSSIKLDALGNIYVTGASAGIGTTVDYATIKYKPTGVQQWVARYNGPANGEDGPRKIGLDGPGNVYVTGASDGGASNSDYATIKYNTSGAQQWVVRYNGPGNAYDAANSIALDGSSNLYITGQSAGLGTGSDYATIKYNSSGVLQWLARYNGPGNGGDQGISLTLDAAANVYVTGASEGMGSSSDIATIKYNSFGANLWLMRYNGPGNDVDWAHSIIVDASQYVYVTGPSWGLGTIFDYVTIKYAQTAAREGVIPVAGDIDLTSKFHVFHYPNPVSSVAKIQYELPFDGRVSINVYDMLGRKVATLINADKKLGCHNTDLNVSLFRNGLYYYRAILNGEKKIVTQSGTITVVK